MDYENLLNNLKKRGFEAYFCASKQEAAKQALSLLSDGDVVTWGGTMTLFELGLDKELKQGNYTVIDRNDFLIEERGEAYRKAFFADAYFTSANAISQDGEIVNVDGTANRVAAICYGPEKVIMLIGKNKIANNLDLAIKRAREVAAPKNAQRFEILTPCKKTQSCADCTSTDCICSQILITRFCKPQGRIKVILVDEELGF